MVVIVTSDAGGRCSPPFEAISSGICSTFRSIVAAVVCWPSAGGAVTICQFLLSLDTVFCIFLDNLSNLSVDLVWSLTECPLCYVPDGKRTSSRLAEAGSLTSTTLTHFVLPLALQAILQYGASNAAFDPNYAETGVKCLGECMKGVSWSTCLQTVRQMAFLLSKYDNRHCLIVSVCFNYFLRCLNFVFNGGDRQIPMGSQIPLWFQHQVSVGLSVGPVSVFSVFPCLTRSCPAPICWTRWVG